MADKYHCSMQQVSGCVNSHMYAQPRYFDSAIAIK
jgi:hypothetical protein